MTITLAAPAKLNLYLHITGKRDDGYHLLDSLSAPVNGIADRVSISEAAALTLTLQGAFAPLISADAPEKNLVWRAATALASHLGRPPHVSITLEKNIPPGAGLGGGSSDAAATVKALLRLWDAQVDDTDIHRLLTPLGADIPACYADAPMIMRGVGDKLSPAPSLPPLPIVVIYPGVPSSTPLTYKNFSGPFRPAVSLPSSFANTAEAIAFIAAQSNDLASSAMLSVPAIKDVLDALNAQDDIKLSRMTGSGSACFGIFGSDETAQKAAEQISRSAPLSWWVRRGGLFSPR